MLNYLSVKTRPLLRLNSIYNGCRTILTSSSIFKAYLFYSKNITYFTLLNFRCEKHGYFTTIHASKCKFKLRCLVYFIRKVCHPSSKMHERFLLKRYGRTVLRLKIFLLRFCFEHYSYRK